MPWTASDADRHVDGLSPHQREVWAAAANSALAECLEDGGETDECEGRAIRIANAAAQGAPREAPEKRVAVREQKTIRLEQFKVLSGDEGGDAGRFAGYGSVFNAVDLVGDTVLPGAYAETLPKFVRDGFIAWGHDWDNPIATVDAAREDEWGLWLEASFHSHPEAQRVRTLAAERLARGKTMGLSIGFQAKDWKLRSDGIRELLAIELMETSLVTFPAEPQAQVTAVKGGAPPPNLWTSVPDAERRLVELLEELQREQKEGRVLSSRNVQRLKDNMGNLRAVLEELEALLEDATPKRDEDDGKRAVGGQAAPEGMRAWAEYQQTLARRYAVRA
jgi:uncharacterized protein